MPAVVLEANTKGLPVIATPEALGDCGNLLPTTDDDISRSRVLAEAIVNWAGEPEGRRSVGVRA